MCQDLRYVDERPEKRHLARVHEVPVTDGALEARLCRYVPPHERVDGVDSKVAAVLEQVEQGANSGTGVGRIHSAEDGDGVVHR